MNDSVEKADTPAYLVAMVSISDDTGRYMTDYALPVIPIVAKYGGEVLAASSDANKVEGKGHFNWTVILRFQNRKQLDAFYFSSEYEPYLKLRKESLTKGGEVVLVTGFDSSVRLG